MNGKLILTVCVFALCSATAGAQSPWTRSKAGFYAQAAWHFIPEYDDIFSPIFDRFPMDRKLSENTLQLYGEYGVTSKTTLVASLPLRIQKSGEFLGNFAQPETSSGTLTGLGNTSLGIRQALVGGNIKLTGSLRVDLPVDRYDDETGLSTGYNAWTFEPMLSTGMGFGKAYWFAYLGYGFRTNDFSNFVDAGVEGGIRIKRFWLIGFSQWMHSLENGTVMLPSKNRLTALYINDQGWLSLGLKGIVEFNRFWGVVASAAGAADGQWVPKKPGFSIGTYFKWD